MMIGNTYNTGFLGSTVQITPDLTAAPNLSSILIGQLGVTKTISEWVSGGSEYTVEQTQPDRDVSVGSGGNTLIVPTWPMWRITLEIIPNGLDDEYFSLLSQALRNNRQFNVAFTVAMINNFGRVVDSFSRCTFMGGNEGSSSSNGAFIGKTWSFVSTQKNAVQSIMG